MRTTLEIPDTLIKEAMIATQIKTKNKVVKLALEELIKKAKISELKQFQGK
ncbi:MAG: type II toxin-antitoxin system VapB family antitoxin, partial [Nitrosomonadales bacterium]|nr:type II toxin-antitoxin system VapB family antitoxin [Nitrosomonadales bacterium]